MLNLCGSVSAFAPAQEHLQSAVCLKGSWATTRMLKVYKPRKSHCQVPMVIIPGFGHLWCHHCWTDIRRQRASMTFRIWQITTEKTRRFLRKMVFRSKQALEKPEKSLNVRCGCTTCSLVIFWGSTSRYSWNCCYRQSWPMSSALNSEQKREQNSWKECGVIGVLSLGQSSQGRKSWPQAQPGSYKTWVSPNSSILHSSRNYLLLPSSI